MSGRRSALPVERAGLDRVRGAARGHGGGRPGGRTGPGGDVPERVARARHLAGARAGVRRVPDGDAVLRGGGRRAVGRGGPGRLHVAGDDATISRGVRRRGDDGARRRVGGRGVRGRFLLGDDVPRGPRGVDVGLGGRDGGGRARERRLRGVLRVLRPRPATAAGDPGRRLAAGRSQRASRRAPPPDGRPRDAGGARGRRGDRCGPCELDAARELGGTAGHHAAARGAPPPVRLHHGHGAGGVGDAGVDAARGGRRRVLQAEQAECLGVVRKTMSSVMTRRQRRLEPLDPEVKAVSSAKRVPLSPWMADIQDNRTTTLYWHG